MKDNLRLYFFRHAEAEPESATLPDHARPLTARGTARTQRAARVLKALEVNPARLYSSPLVRARQTADILSDTFGVPVEVRQEVGPGFNAQTVEALVKDMDSDEAAMFVGHEPDFSATISALIGGGGVEIKKGGLARIDLDSYQPLRGSLVWLIAPKVFDEH
jgi:phosphohistidine phosphatase